MDILGLSWHIQPEIKTPMTSRQSGVMARINSGKTTGLANILAPCHKSRKIKLKRKPSHLHCPFRCLASLGIVRFAGVLLGGKWWLAGCNTIRLGKIRSFSSGSCITTASVCISRSECSPSVYGLNYSRTTLFAFNTSFTTLLNYHDEVLCRCPLAGCCSGCRSRSRSRSNSQQDIEWEQEDSAY